MLILLKFKIKVTRGSQEEELDSTRLVASDRSTARHAAMLVGRVHRCLRLLLAAKISMRRHHTSVLRHLLKKRKQKEAEGVLVNE